MNSSPTPSGESDEVPDTTPLPGTIDMDQQTVGEAFNALQRMLHYSTSLPGTLRSASAYASELMRESANWLVPSAFRNSRSYSLFVQQMWEYVTKEDGDQPTTAALERSESPEPNHEQVSLAHRTLGSLLDMSALATFHLSPLTVMAIFSEVAYGSTIYIQLLGSRLKQQGLIAPETRVQSTEDLLKAIEQASGEAAKLFDNPPLSVDGLRKTIAETRSTVGKVDANQLLPFSEIDQLWRQMELAARDQRASIWDVSATISLVALNHIQAVDQGGLVKLEISGNLFQEHIIDHYWEGLRSIERHGLLPTLSQASQPHLETVWTNYAMDHKTWTELFLSGELLKWGWSQLSWPKLSRGST